jgi:hypothetical protein
MAGKPLIGTNCWQELSYTPLLLSNRDCRPFRLCRLSKGRVKRSKPSGDARGDALLFIVTKITN